MTALRLRFGLPFIVVLACASVLTLTPLCLAQQPDSSDLPPLGGIQDNSGCPPLTILWPIAGATAVSCQHGDSVEVTLPLQPDYNGNAQEKRVRGAFEYREYQVDKMGQDMAFDNMIRELPQAGFRVIFSSKPSTITGRKEDTWALINMSGEFYNVSVVQGPPETWTAVKTAAEISSEMQAHNRVDIYGIEFSAPDQTIQEKQSPILFEILTYLKQSPDVSVVVESHKWSTDAPPETDSEITRERANAVTDWLVTHGIARTRVQPRPFGRDKPFNGNESPSEVERNERIALAKVPG
jgi:outer membrane protein OmpA-like peptidoglycan-associated protein